MGVEGLLRVLKEILDERQVGYITNLYARARGKRLAIDGHGFLHRLVVIPRFDGVAKEPRAVVSSLNPPPWSGLMPPPCLSLLPSSAVEARLRVV